MKNFKITTLKILQRQADLWVLLLFIASIASSSIPVAMGFSFSRLVTEETFNTQDIYFVAFLTFLEVPITLARLFASRKILNRSGEIFRKRFTYRNISTPGSGKIIYRNYNLYTDHLIESYQFIFDCFFIVVLSILSTIEFGFLPTLVILGLVPFVPFINQLVKKSNFYYRHVQKLTDLRTGKLNSFTKFRTSYQGVNKRSGAQFRQLSKIFKFEMFCRNADSFLKSLEIYVNAFSRFAPFIVVSIIHSYVAPDELLNSKQLFWVGLPIVSSFFRLPRGIVALKMLKRIKLEMDNRLGSLINSKLDQPVIIGDSQELWEGTLTDNVIFPNADARNVINHMGLCVELELDDPFSNDYIIHKKGGNISAGQRTRLIFARAVAIAGESNIRVELDISFDSLDNNNKLLIKKWLDSNLVARFIYLTRRSADTLRTDSESEAAYSDLQKDKYYTEGESSVSEKEVFGGFNKFIFFAKLVKYTFFPAILAATLNAFIYMQAGSTDNLSAKWITAITAMFFGILLILISGCLVEMKIRKISVANIFSGLTSTSTTEQDWNTSLFVELNYVVEAFAFYCHDLVWIISLFSVAAIMMYWNIGIIGLFFATALLIFFTMIYLFIYPDLSKARQLLVTSSSKFIEDLDNVTLIQSAPNTTPIHLVTLALREQILLKGIVSWTEAKFHLISVKEKIGLYGNIGLGIIYVCVFISFGIVEVSSPIRALILGSLLAIDSECIRLFAATSGFSVQFDAYKKIELFSKDSESNHKISTFSQKDSIQIESMLIENIQCQSKEFSLNQGLNKLDAQSGAGKSSLMKQIFLNKNNGVLYSAQYYDCEFLQAIKWIECQQFGTSVDDVFEIIREESGNTKLLLLDECFLQFDRYSSSELYDKLEKWAMVTGKSVLYVDHRMTKGIVLKLTDLLLI